MYLEAKETARLYKLLTEKLGGDTTEAMFKYIDNKTERSVEATIKTLATKDDLLILRKDLGGDITHVKDEITKVNLDLSNRFSDMIKWVFIFWVGQLGAILGIAFLFF